MPSSCCVRGCSNKQTFYGYSMFGFPSDPDIKSKWVKAVSTNTWEPKAHHRICEVHFETDLVYFVGSRKELKKNAVPTLFCNCVCLQSISEIQEKGCLKIKDEPTINCRYTILDHSYSQNLSVSTEQNKKHKCCKDSRKDPSAAKKKPLKHASDCNLARGALKNTQKGKKEPCNLESSLRQQQNGLEMPNSAPIIKLVKSSDLMQNHTQNNVIRKAKDSQTKLKSQLQNALNENAKLKKELNMLKTLIIPSNLLANKVRLVGLEKVA